MSYGPSPKPISERFWDKVNFLGPEGCWMWRGAVNDRGYGRFYVNGRGPVLAHRVSWELSNGPIPAGLCACHHCDTPPCVNPVHLFLGTRGDNSLDMKIKMRSPRTTGDRNGKSKITEAEAYKLRKKWATGLVTQAVLAQEFGLHPSHVSRIVRGLRR